MSVLLQSVTRLYDNIRITVVATGLTRQAARRTKLAAVEKKATSRACAICGARQDEGADIRVCSCEKCGGKPRDLCLAHAREH